LLGSVRRRISSTAALDPAGQIRHQKKGKKQWNLLPTTPQSTPLDPHTAAWCTASNPNPGAELQSDPRLKSSSRTAFDLLTTRCAPRAIGVPVFAAPLRL